MTPRGLRDTELNVSGLLSSSQRPGKAFWKEKLGISPKVPGLLTESHLSETLSSSSKLPVPEVTSFCCSAFPFALL